MTDMPSPQEIKETALEVSGGGLAGTVAGFVASVAIANTALPLVGGLIGAVTVPLLAHFVFKRDDQKTPAKN